MLTLPLVLLLSAAPVRLAAPGLSCESAAPAVCAAYLERFSSLLSAPGLEVLTASAVASLLGLERQRQLLGCSDSECVLEVAGALDVDGLVSGTVVKTPVGWLATLKVLRARDGSTWAQATTRVKSEEELERFLDTTALQFREQLLPPPPPSAAGARVVRWIPAMAGAASLATGAVLYGLSKGDAAALRGATLEGDPGARAAAGSLKEKLGLTLAGVGLAAIAASVLWAALAPEVSVVAAPVPGGGGAVLVGGTW